MKLKCLLLSSRIYDSIDLVVCRYQCRTVIFIVIISIVIPSIVYIVIIIPITIAIIFISNVSTFIIYISLILNFIVERECKLIHIVVVILKIDIYRMLIVF